MSDTSQPNSNDNSPESTLEDNSLFVVGIGASAGGLSALEELFSNLSTASGAAFVVIQHLSPDFKSLMKELLERHTSMPIYRVTEGMELQANSVYLIPPGQNLALEKRILRLENRKISKNNKHELNFPIDLFFKSLAKNFGERSVGVILSGSGSDGSRGLKAIYEAGGVALVQDPETAEFDGMPNSAIATDIVHQVLPPRELSQLIYQCVTAPVNSAETESSRNELISAINLNQIAKILLEEEGLDFSLYKSSTVSRRIHRRCLINKVKSIDDYIALLLDSTEEREILCSDLLINVTHFFRDYPAWQSLANNILPKIIEQAKDEAELRFWITACSTGEEAYSLAILVHEALQDCSKNIRVKIFATDIDRLALEKASQGIYPPSIATDIDPERLQKYFIAKDNSYHVMRKIREMLIFSPHDLTKDAGFTRLNLIACRNVLIYMKSTLQYQVLRNLHFSLAHQGVLFLGEAETLGEFESEFDVLDKKWKFFQKRRDVRLPIPLHSNFKNSNYRINKSSSFRFTQPQNRIQLEPILEQCLNRIAEESDAIILLVSQDNNLLHVSGDSSKIFKAPGGKITTEVGKMVVFPLSLPLNTALHRAKQNKKPVLYQGIQLEQQEDIVNFTLEVIPPCTNRKHGDFFLVKIKQEKAAIPVQVVEIDNSELGNEASHRILELEAELKQTRENLQALVEELETTNEEQQASNEELTASNEELQSTNEELHSVNEELHTVNIEYQAKIGELTQLNDDVDNLLQSTEIGVIFLDSELKIRKFTPAVKAAIALRSTDLDRPLEELYWKFDCPNLLELLHEVLRTREAKELEVSLKQESSYFLMQIHLYRTESQDSNGLVISFIQIDEIKQAQKELEQEVIARQRSEKQLRITQQRVENIFTSLEDAIWSLELPEKNLAYLNDSFTRIYGRDKADFSNNNSLWFDLIHPEDKKMVQQAHQGIKQQEKLDLEYRIVHGDGSIRWVRDRSKLIYDDAGTPIRQDFVITDITEQKRAEQALKAKEQSFQAIFNSMFQFIGVLDTKGILLQANQTALEFGGLTPEDVLNRPFWEAKWWTISQETQKKLKEAIARAAKGEFIRYEVDVLGANNRIATIDFSLKPVTDETGKVIQLIPEGREISELKQAREELRQTNLELEQRVIERTQSLARFSDRLQQLHRLATSHYDKLEDLLYDYLQTGCQMFDLTTGIISQVKNEIYRIVAVKSPLDLKVGDETPCIDTYCAEVVKQKTTIFYTEIGKIAAMQNNQVYLNLGLEFFIGTPIFVNGKLYGTLNFSDTKSRHREFTEEDIKVIELMARDIGNFITSAQAEAALRESTIRFRNTFEQAAMGMAHVSPKGKFIRVNQRLCNIIGYPNDVLLSKTFQDITHPEDLDTDLEYVKQMLSGEISNYSMEKRYFKADGSIIWVNLTVSLVKEESRKPEYFISVIEDISDRKNAEIILEESRIELQQANQAKDNFIAHMSHELRTPLNSVIGFSQLLKKDDSLPQKQRKLIDVIHQSGEHLLTLINDILDLSKLTANKLELNHYPLHLDSFFQEISTIFQVRAQEKGLDFITDLDANLPKIAFGDETRLRQVLLNLLSNAFKFTTTGTVTLSVSLLDSESQTIRFQVEDTGSGIPEDKYELIFAPFGQLNQDNNISEGTGLGLPICQNILQLMDSKLNLTSKEGQGSCFWFDLQFKPIETNLLAQFTINVIQQNSLKLETLKTPCKVLVVDDNEDNRALLTNYLQPLGFTVEEAENGREGIKIAETFQPDVILVDLLMPIMDGITMIKRLKKHPQLKDKIAIVISANVSSSADLSNIGCDGLLVKPIDLSQLLQLLEQHLPLCWSSPDTEIFSNKAKSTNLIVPSPEELILLLELVSIGNMEAAIEKINLLEISDSQYIPFARKVRQLADNCQQNQLENLLKQYL